MPPIACWGSSAGGGANGRTELVVVLLAILARSGRRPAGLRLPCTCGEPGCDWPTAAAGRPRLHTRLPRPRAWRRLRRCRHRLPPQSRRQLQQKPWRNLTRGPAGEAAIRLPRPNPETSAEREPLCSNGPRPRSTRASGSRPERGRRAVAMGSHEAGRPAGRHRLQARAPGTKPSVVSAKLLQRDPGNPPHRPPVARGARPAGAGRL